MITLFQAVVDIRNTFNQSGVSYPNLGTAGVDPGKPLASILSTILPVAISLGGIATFLYLIWGGINWLFSGGDKGKIEAARERITNALIGLAIIASAFAIYSIVDKYFGIGNTGQNPVNSLQQQLQNQNSNTQNLVSPNNNNNNVQNLVSPNNNTNQNNLQNGLTQH